MKKKKNTAAVIGVAAAVIIGVGIIVSAALVLAEIIKSGSDNGTDGILDKEDQITVEEEKSEALAWQTAEPALEDVIAVFETESGSFSVKLFSGKEGDAFKSLAAQGAFSDREFSTAAKDMFIQTEVQNTDVCEKTENELGCFYGAVGFVTEGNIVSDSIVIITANKLSGTGKAYLMENGFSAERSEIYKSLGGIPEYEGKVLVFGQVTSGFDVIDFIAKGETDGYTGGYAVREPIKLVSVTISENK